MKAIALVASLLMFEPGCASTQPESRAPVHRGFPAQADGLSVRGAPLQVGSTALKRPTLFVFWASWCKPCNREAPELVALAKRLEGKLDIIGVNVDTERAPAIEFIERHQLPYPSLRDPELAFSDALKVKGTPTLVLVDAGGRELARGKRLHEVQTAFGAVDARPISRSETLMGTSIEIVLYAPDDPAAHSALDAALAEIARVEAVFSTWKPESKLSGLNQAQGAKRALPDEVLNLLEDGLSLCEMTDGKFDITFKGAERVWNFRNHDARPPSATDAKRAMALVDCEKLHIDRSRGTAWMDDPRMQVGLGGIAKGYGVDRAAQILEARGFRNFVVNAGGDLLTRGRNAGRLWTVGIKHPRRPEKALAILPVSGYAVATSGDYERYFEHDGRRYHHILDPDTGLPATGCQSVTILAKKAAWADALATGVFVLGPKRGLALVDQLDGVEALVVAADGSLHASRGLPVTHAPRTAEVSK